MERLTKRSKYGVELVEKYGFTEIENTARVIYRLAAYEDTGLTPEEIMTLIAPDDPLTLEELRQMDGEPVWVHSLDDDYGEWVLFQKIDLGKTCAFAVIGATRNYYDGYGKTWLAYRRRPEDD